MNRVEYLREQLAALESYGNADGQRAAAARAEIATLEPPVKRATQTRRAAD